MYELKVVVILEKIFCYNLVNLQFPKYKNNNYTAQSFKFGVPNT